MRVMQCEAIRVVSRLVPVGLLCAKTGCALRKGEQPINLMSLSNPLNQDPSKSGSVRPTRLGDLSVPFAPTAAPLGQIRGISKKGSTGAGIPKHVSNVASSLSQASTGMTSAVSVTYSRDPGDASHEKVNVYVKGYQGNSSPVQIASGSESPVTFVLNNTGETVSILVQSQGNSGSAPLSTAPSTGVQIPKSNGGGFGTGTVTGVSVTPTPTVGQLAKFTGAASIGGANLSGDVTTVNSAAATVVAIRGTSVDTQAPLIGDCVEYSPFGGGKYIPASPTRRSTTLCADGENTVPVAFGGIVPGGFGTVSSSAVVRKAGAIAGEGPAISLQCALAGSTSVQASYRAGLNSTQATAVSYSLASARRFLFRQRSNTDAAYRVWVGVTTSVTVLNGVLFAADAPAADYAAFRFSSATDTTWKAVTAFSGSQTVVNTGVAYNSTTSTFFEIIPNAAGTSLTFRINGVTVATIATNLFGADTSCITFSTADNKNTSTVVAITIDFEYATVEYK